MKYNSFSINQNIYYYDVICLKIQKYRRVQYPVFKNEPLHQIVTIKSFGYSYE